MTRLPLPRRRALAAALVGALTASLAARDAAGQTYTLTFGDLGAFSNTAALSPAYGTAANLSVTNRARTDFGNSALDASGLCLWNSGYGDLTQVAYTCNSGAGVGEFTFVPAAGYQVTLARYDVAEYLGRIAGVAETRVYTLGFTSLLFSGTTALGASDHWTVTPGLTSTTGLTLQWGDNYDYGIDNITVTVAPIAPTAVPEPATVALVAAGLVALGVVRRRHRAA